MKLKRVIIYLLLISLTSCSYDIKIDVSDSNKPNEILKKITKKLVPDKRDHIFEIIIEKKQNNYILTGFSDFPVAVKTLKDSLEANKIHFKNEIVMLPTEKYKNLKGITRLSVANLRAKPKHSSELVTQTLMGMQLIPLQEKNDFIRVKTPANYYAWVDKAGIELVDNSKFDEWKKMKKIIITTNYGQSHKKQDINSPIVSDYVLNDVFGLGKIEKNYYKIIYPDGKIAFIPKKDAIKLEDFININKLVTGKKIVEQAKKLLGTPYLWGGTSSKGLDCSGFTKTVYTSFGFNLPRDASQQAKTGKEIMFNKNNFSQLKPGDLLFFGKIKNGKAKITHVAIHIDNGKIIHATGEVKIESLNQNDKNFNQKRFDSWLISRRIISEFPVK